MWRKGSADTGSIVWSVVQESPGDDLPPEPAIRAEATIPGKNLQLRMTIKRNGDTTLPASHIIEMIFLTPENFDGGGIENILRVALKDTEAVGRQRAARHSGQDRRRLFPGGAQRHQGRDRHQSDAAEAATSGSTCRWSTSPVGGR